MTLILSGTNGVSDVDGTAATPAIRGSDTNTGIFFPAADTIAFAEGGAEVARFDASGNLLVGATSSSGRLTIKNPSVSGSQTILAVQNAASTGTIGSVTFNQDTDAFGVINNTSGGALFFSTNNTERARIDSSGNLLVGTTGFSGGGRTQIQIGSGSSDVGTRYRALNNGNWACGFENASASVVGSIVIQSSATVYNTSSDYRLKENIAPMTGALAKVQALKPCIYKWKVDGADGQGFIAHELAEVVPDCVTGDKDAVDAEGNPVYQGIDTSFLVATLTAALQELKAELDTVKTELAVLKGQA